MNALADLPAAGERRLAVRVTADALRQIRGGSPWVYDGSITTASHDGSPGDLAVVFDDRRNFAGIGLWDPASPIRIKMLHQGRPATIDRDWWRHRIGSAIERREVLVAGGSTTGYRCVHGENDGLPGLVVDRYADTLVVKLYSPIWFPHLANVVDVLVDLIGAERVVLRLSRHVAAGETFGLSDGATIVGDAPNGPVLFRERGLVFEADVVHGNKTGHFLDQRDNRALVRGMASGASVLDVFSSTGGFSLAAAAGGARSVHLIDQAAPALAAAERNFAHNARRREVHDCEVEYTAADAFQALADLARRRRFFDLVIIDPPSFASSQASVERALAAYRKLTHLGLQVVEHGGTIVQASCSSRVTTDEFTQAVIAAAEYAGAKITETRRTGHAVDHPVGFEFGAYLKAIYFTVERAAHP